MKQGLLWVMVVAVTWLLVAGALAQNVWKGAGTNDWYGDTANWSQGHFPLAGEDVMITNAGVGVTLTSAAPASGWLSSLVVSNTATLIFSNWNTTLSATNVTIQTNGVMTLPQAFTNNQMSNNVYIVCSNLTVAAGGSINADGKGYKGGNLSATWPSNTAGNGPGAGARSYWFGTGAGYGGFGGPIIAGSVYGSATEPLYPGSGGGSALSWDGGNGGGAVWIAAAGRVTVNGLITANGTGNSPSGGGSGGGIYITCAMFAGTNGIITANGGNSLGSGDGQYTGGGGRIAVNYNSAAQSNEPIPSVQFSVMPGLVGGYPGDIGTLYFSDSSFLSAQMTNIQGRIYGFSSWTTESLTISNRWIGFSDEGFRLTITNDLTIAGSSGRLEIGGSVATNISDFPFYFGATTSAPVLTIGGNLILTNSGTLYVYSAMTNSALQVYGSLVSVTRDVWIGSNSGLYLNSHPTNGGSPLCRMRNLTISASGNLNANGTGYAAGGAYGAGKWTGWPYGPGGGAPGRGTARGGSYGNTGGYANVTATYGSSNAPVDPGSGGAGTYYGHGGNAGGLVRVEAIGAVTVNGAVSANGRTAEQYGAGGSGGGIYLRCKTFSGSSAGNLSACGGAGNNNSEGGGGGSGGRIAVWRVSDAYGGSCSVTGNVGYLSNNGGDGTIVWGLLPAPGTVVKFR